MQAYIASSWKNQHAVEMLTAMLRGLGHQVESFVENRGAGEQTVKGDDFNLDAWIASEEGRAKFNYDVTSVMTSDAVVYIGPSGPDTWAEVGMAFARGVPVIGLQASGEQVGLMRLMVSCWCDSYHEVLKEIDGLARNLMLEKAREKAGAPGMKAPPRPLNIFKSRQAQKGDGDGSSG